MTIQLRSYQQQLVNEIRGQYQLGRKSVLAVLPTGAGILLGSVYTAMETVCPQELI